MCPPQVGLAILSAIATRAMAPRPKKMPEPPRMLTPKAGPGSAKKIRTSESEKKKRRKGFSSLRIGSQGSPATAGDAPGISVSY